jgi:tRNA pseudouridine38-40 synthase
VHAFNQIIKITSEVPMDSNEALCSINQILPSDIKLITFKAIEGAFKPSTQTKSKEYIYLFTNSAKTIGLSDQEFIANFGKKLNLDLMKDVLPLFVGEHNFQNFYSKGSNVTSTIRTIYSIELKTINPHEIFNGSLFSAPEHLTECYQLKINGSGFLKQMIRHIVSSLWMIGTEKMSTLQLKEYIEGNQQTNQLWKVAPPNGLFLNKINY